jgi:hypothetical protein
MLNRFLLPTLVCALCALAGCSGSKNKPVPVSGTVELDGKPMAEGQITFAGEAGSPPQTLEVKGGKFEGEVTPGKKRVEIHAFRQGKPTKMGEEVIEGGPENYIPPAYNTESKITAEVGENGITPNKFEAKSK